MVQVLPAITVAAKTTAQTSVAMWNGLKGYRTFVMCGIGAIVIIANHFNLLPAGYAPTGLDPNNWVVDLIKLGIVVFAKAGLNNSTNAIVRATATGQVPSNTPPAS